MTPADLHDPPSPPRRREPMSLAELRAQWSADLHRHTGQRSLRHLLVHLLLSDGDERFSDGMKYMFYARLCRYLQAKKPALVFWPLYRLSKRILTRYKYKFGVAIPHTTSIGPGFYIGHIRDIVINEAAVIGANCNISQGVTIGQANRGPRKGTPVIGDRVYIGPGAKIVGAVRVGHDAAIGANCVVTRDVPDHAVVVGVPGRIISFEGSRAYVNRTVETPRPTERHDQLVRDSAPDREDPTMDLWAEPGDNETDVTRAGWDRGDSRRCAP
ncbi:MAG TPA: serine O-acetyltransferase [Nitrospira sp.]|nr:serine O-acetyltransferase [Nitrospira sp.]